MWEESIHAPGRPFELYAADGLQHWPVGYHLHIIAGFLLSGVDPAGGRILTLLMAALCPVLLYFIAQRLLSGPAETDRRILSVVAGLVAGVLLPLNATYTRMGLSLMSDAPSCFWALLAVYFFVTAAPLPGAGAYAGTARARSVSFALAGLAMGLAVLTRYGSALLVAPIAVYLILAAFPEERKEISLPIVVSRLLPALWAVPTFLLALAPQGLYLLTHDPGTGAGDFLGSFNVGNIFATSTTGPDGTATFERPMIVFYLLSPLLNAQAGFYSAFFIPALALGVAFLWLHHKVRLLVFLLVWWLAPALIYSATPYQAHRFAILYMPAIAILIGCGVGYAVVLLIRQVPKLVRPASPGRKSLLAAGLPALIAALVLLMLGVGLIQGWNSVRDWVATHAAWQEEDRSVVALIEQSVPPNALAAGPPWVVTHGFSAPLYHYTQWPVLELYFAEPSRLAEFLAGPEPHLAVVPEESLDGQWFGTETGENWRSLKSDYTLERKGRQGAYTIYTIIERQTAP
jgi:4-amino-4-deoxy-L-arabinose transferase-like glycosyltransferase